MNSINPQLFDAVLELPDPTRQQQFDSLVGLESIKETLVKEGTVLLNPTLLADWSNKYHKQELPCVRTFRERPPLILFSGDVGTGKTSLAESFGDAIARREKIKIRVLRMSLFTRGRGAVGEMTRLISQAFSEVEQIASRGIRKGLKPASGVILIIDEADALAQSRSEEQMHHEDRAGVNALIRGIDMLTSVDLPVMVVMCTNRDNAMDPAILRRVATHHVFNRPTAEQRVAVFKGAFGKVLSGDELARIGKLTGRSNGREYGFTYSDLLQRLVPAVVMSAFPDQAITLPLVESVIEREVPTAPFDSSGNHNEK